MLYLLMANGSHKELDGAFTAHVEGEDLVCRDFHGEVFERYNRFAVTAFGHNKVLRAHAFTDGYQVWALPPAPLSLGTSPK